MNTLKKYGVPGWFVVGLVLLCAGGWWANQWLPVELWMAGFNFALCILIGLAVHCTPPLNPQPSTQSPTQTHRSEIMSKTETAGRNQPPQAPQMSTDPEAQNSRMHAESPAAASVDPAGCQAQGRRVESEHAQRAFERAKAQQISRRAEAAKQRCYRAFEDGSSARCALALHIHKSLPRWTQTKSTRLQVLLSSVHRKAAELALRQAHRSVHQQNLTQIADTRRFVLDHCGWYMTFCGLMGWVYARLGWLPAAGKATVPPQA